MEKANLENFYKQNIIQELHKELNCDNVMQVPRLEKIVLNIEISM